MTIMAQPTQDMDISSSLTPNDNSLNNVSSSNKHYYSNITREELETNNLQLF